MKINSLQVTEFAGIRHLSLPLEGRSAVIWGDNGVGKSGIVDAIDFLLSGAVTRLSGRGAGDLSLACHGPHVRAAPEDACIAADVALADGVALHVTRWVSRPASLVGPAEVESAFHRVSDRGQHLLTRRDILSVITVPPGDRAEQINQLLNLSPIEQVRGRLVTLRNVSGWRPPQRVTALHNSASASLTCHAFPCTISIASLLRSTNDAKRLTYSRSARSPRTPLPALPQRPFQTKPPLAD